MKHTVPTSRVATPVYVAIPLALVLGLAACTDKIEEEEGVAEQPSMCPLNAPTSPFQAMSSDQGRARLYSEQPQVVVWDDSASTAGVQAMSLEGNYVAVYDKACVAEGQSPMAFPEVKAELLLGDLNYKAVEVWADSNDTSFRDLVREDKCLKTLGPNGVVSVQSVGEAKSLSFTPNDALFTDQKHHEFLETSAAWDIFYDDLDGISGGAGEVIVAVVDTGTNTLHEEFKDQLWKDGDGHHGRNFYTTYGQHKNDVSDDNGHGTHVAGLIAAAIENGKGGAGVIPVNVKIMTVKALGGPGGQGSVANVIDAVNYAVQNGAHVINMSLGIGGTGAGTSLKSTIENAVASGAFIAAAAGNASQQISTAIPVSPAMYAKDLAGLMSVGSLDTETGARSDFSNYSSSYVEIFAPGSRGYIPGLGKVGLWAPVGVNGYRDYEDFRGTSMAAPMVAGAAALAIAYYDEWNKPWTPALIEQHIKSTSLQDCQLWDYGQQGRYLNLKRLAEEVSETVLP